MYRIGYINANSLPEEKFAQAIGLLESSFDCLFVAEHWYQHHQSRLAHPLIHSSTKLNPASQNKPRRGRHHGGIYLLAQPHFRSLIQYTNCTEHSITLSIPGFRISSVYFPPYSLPNESVPDELDSIGPVDLLLGDLNCRFHCNPSTNRRPPTSALAVRSQLIQAWAVKNGMVHLSNQASHATVDHIPDHAFSSTKFQSQLQLSLLPTQRIPFHTDHKYLLSLKWHPTSQPSSTTSSTACDPQRFHIQRLREPKTALRYRDSWSALDRFSGSHHQSERYDVDMLDALLLGKIQAIADIVLGMYKPNEVKKEADGVAFKLAARSDLPATMQLMKRALRASSTNTPVISSTPACTPIQECTQHYSSIFCPDDDQAGHQHRLQLRRDPYHTPSPLNRAPQPPPPPPPHNLPDPTDQDLLASGLLDVISLDTIKLQIQKMSTTTSPGLDGIHVQMLRHLIDTSLPAELCTLFQACLRSGKTPMRWNESLLYPLHKDKSKQYTAQNSRPISLICLFRKIFESLILPIVRHSGAIEYSPVQAGFRTGYSSLTNVLALDHLIQAGNATHVSFLDFASAFDKVQWSHLKCELEKQGIHPVVLRLIHQLMYNDLTFSLVVNGATSPQLPRRCGLLQGSPLSPILFSRFINGLLNVLNRNQPSHLPAALFFADDGVIMARTIAQSQELLDHAQSWASNHGMSFNISKCGHLHTGTRTTSTTSSYLHLGNKQIPKVDKYKYLGVMFERRGIDYAEQANILSTRVRKLRGAISWNSDTWPPRIRYNIFKAIITPTMEYSLPLIYAHYLDHKKMEGWATLRQAYNDSINWIAGGNAKRQHLTANLLGILSFEDRCRHLHTHFYHHLATAHRDNPIRAMIYHFATSSHVGSKRKCFPPKTLLARFHRPPPLYARFLNEVANNDKTLTKQELSLVLAADKRKKIVLNPPKAAKLIQVTKPSERAADMDCDAVLKAPAADQAKFLAWRRGVFGWGRKCACGKRFNRGHAKCMPYPRRLLTSDQHLAYNLDTMIMDDEIKYTTVDFLLNERAWDKARTLLDFYYSTMAKHL